jgi:hypothetical protein
MTLSLSLDRVGLLLVPRLDDGLARDLAALEITDRDAQHFHAIRIGAGLATQHPIYRVAVEAARDMLKYAAEFGLTPSARTRIGNGIAAALSPSKFDGLLGP